MVAETRAERRAEDVDLCARALFERCKNAGVAGLETREWDSLPDHVPDDVVMGKSYYRREVQLSVEETLRAGRARITPEQPNLTDGYLGEADNGFWEYATKGRVYRVCPYEHFFPSVLNACPECEAGMRWIDWVRKVGMIAPFELVRRRDVEWAILEAEVPPNKNPGMELVLQDKLRYGLWL